MSARRARDCRRPGRRSCGSLRPTTAAPGIASFGIGGVPCETGEARSRQCQVERRHAGAEVGGEQKRGRSPLLYFRMKAT